MSVWEPLHTVFQEQIATPFLEDVMDPWMSGLASSGYDGAGLVNTLLEDAFSPDYETRLSNRAGAMVSPVLDTMDDFFNTRVSTWEDLMSDEMSAFEDHDWAPLTSYLDDLSGHAEEVAVEEFEDFVANDLDWMVETVENGWNGLQVEISLASMNTRTNRRAGGRAILRKYGRMHGRTGGQADGLVDERKDGHTDGHTDPQRDPHRDPHTDRLTGWHTNRHTDERANDD